MKKFKTFVAYDDKINEEIEQWLESINGTEVARSAPTIAISPYNPSGNFGGNIIVAVTVTAEVDKN